AKPASLPVYPPNPCRIPASVFDGAPQIKGKIKSQINSQINSGSLRIVVWVGCYDDSHGYWGGAAPILSARFFW
ncbi:MULTISPECIES: hypothetical protein, partial [Pseudomonas]|uniref:hypothetical protein n=1 Tax=Pseudomonas TaxID=286 RepID=UPI001C445928